MPQSVPRALGAGNPPAIEGAPTATAAFVGCAAQGPTDAPGFVAGFADYERQYGGLAAGSLLSYAVREFFAAGGLGAYVVRLIPSPGAEGEPGGPAFHAALNADGSRRGAVGARLLDQAGYFGLLCVPGETDPDTIRALQAYARDKRAFLIVDCKRSDDVASLTAPEFRTTALFGPDAINSAFYCPWVTAPDPLDGDRPAAFPPCGFVAGVYAATDAARGVWAAPAGTGATLIGALGLTVDFTDAETARLNAAAVNGLRVFAGRPPVVWGARTLAGGEGSGSDWVFVPVRRLALFIEQSVATGVRWAAFEPNGEPLWGKLRLSVGGFLEAQFRAGAFQGTTAADAYFVKCDCETTTEADVEAGLVNIDIGFAPLKPAEFVVLRIQQAAGAPAS